MSQLTYGRYFILEEDINNLFIWASTKLSGQFRMKNYGECPVRKKMIIASLFESDSDLDTFEADYLNRQRNDSVIYTTRRNPNFILEGEEERRQNLELRQRDEFPGEERRHLLS